MTERDVPGLLARLVERSLVVFEQSGDQARYRLLETIRQYAQAKLLESNEADAIRVAHLAYYVALAERAEPLLRGPAQMAWLARLGSEHDNLRAALAFSLSQPRTAEAGLRLAAALQWFWFMRGRPADEGRQWLDRALSSTSEASAALRARALAGLGMLAWRGNDFARARSALEESLALARTAKDDSTIAFALHHLAHVMEIVGGSQQAEETFEASVSRFRRIADRWGTAWSLRCLGNYGRARGITVETVARLEESLALLRQLGDGWLIANVLVSLGAVAREQENYARANALLEESLAIWRAAGAEYDVAIAYSELGHVARVQGDHLRAATLYRESIELIREAGDHFEIGKVLEGVAALSVAQDHFQQAARILGAADALRRTIGAAIGPIDRRIHEPTITKALEALGDFGFEAAFAEGRRLSVDEVVTEIWGPAVSSPSPARRLPDVSSGARP